MKRSWLLPSLAGLELALAVMLAALSALHIYYTVLNNRAARRLMDANRNRQAFNTLVGESVAYGTRSNSGVISALAEAGIRINLEGAQGAPAPAPVAPRTTKPTR